MSSRKNDNFTFIVVNFLIRLNLRATDDHLHISYCYELKILKTLNIFSLFKDSSKFIGQS